MGLAKDLIRGAFIVIGIALFGSLYQTTPQFFAWVNSFFGGGSLNFYQFAIVYSVIAVGAYIAASIVSYSLSSEENEG